MANDFITFTHNNYKFKLDARILAVTSTSSPFTSVYQGYIGLAPPISIMDKPTSLLSQAKDDGLIDHMVFSLYTDLDQSMQSTIKFGSYDPSAISQGGSITYMKTKSRQSWELLGYVIVVYQSQVHTGPTPKVALIEPQLPYLYIPDEDWIGFINAIIYSY